TLFVLYLSIDSCVYSSHLTLFLFNDTSTTEIYTLSLHDALPIYTGNKKWRYEQTFLFHRVNRRTAMIRPASSRIADSGPVSGETRSARPVAAIRTREETIYWTPARGAGRSSISPYRVLTTGTPAMVPTGSAVAVTRATTPAGGIRRSLPSSRRTTISCGVRFTMAVLHTWASPSSYIPRPPS